MPCKSSPRDFVPTSLFKACSITFSAIIANLANLSFQTGILAAFKRAQIMPLIKRHGLNQSDPSSYRPISNLNPISKIIERLALSRLTSHINSSSTNDCLQSAYKRDHSTETALLKLTDDAFHAMDTKESTILVALDQSAAFDCIDYAVLLSRLHSMFGVSGLALNWFQSYLQSRTSYVKFGSQKSATMEYKIGVPQGSALGPALFSLYIAPLANVVRSFTVNHHQYADDTQLYLAAKCSNNSSQLSLIEGCTTAVHNWLAHNGLCLNPDKPEALCVSSGRAKPTQPSAVVVSGAGITFSESVKSLGVYLDDRLFNKQADSVCKSCFYHIRALRHVRPSLRMDVARTVACSIVSS
jgi:hypothetical protein